MTLFDLEQSTLAYRADTGFYVVAVVAGGACVAATSPPGSLLAASAWIAAGALSWSIIEYAIHRFVLHGLQPFRRWHETHHQRPTALICAPTIVSASLILGLVFLPALAAFGPRRAGAFTLGVLGGYLAYTIIHHASHHWHGHGRWLRRRRRWHAWHHYGTGRRNHFGVSTGLWDRVFGTAQPGTSTPASRNSSP